MLGQLRVISGAQEITRFRTRKTAELLAYLAYYSDRSHPREVLIEMLWPECDMDSGRHNLSMALTSLRQNFARTGDSAEIPLVTDRYTVALNTQAVSTDVGDFESGLLAAEQEITTIGKIPHLSAVVDLYRGEFLPGFYDDWIFPEQQRLEDRYLAAAGALAAGYEAAGDSAKAVDCALGAVAKLPRREETHAEVIRIYMASGQTAAAQRQFTELERILREDLGSEPSPETRALLDMPSAQRSQESLAAAEVRSTQLEPVGGALPLGSRYYIVREQDGLFNSAIARKDFLVLLKGPRQVGKSSLLARGLEHARKYGSRVVLTHFQLFNESHMESPQALMMAIAESLAEQLELDWRPEDEWNERAGANPNFRRFMRRHVLGSESEHIVWGLDEADRIMASPFSSETFGLFRSWNDERALEQDTPWNRLTLAIAYSTEPYLFIQDINQSPFNIGTRLYLDDLNADQVADLNGRYGAPLKDIKERMEMFTYLGGQPYLIQRALYELASHGGGIGGLRKHSSGDEGIFGDHLRRIRALLTRDTGLAQTVLALLRTGAKPDAESFHRLRSSGILAGESAAEARIRCQLYGEYLLSTLN